jgi:hypothetical protein
MSFESMQTMPKLCLQHIKRIWSEETGLQSGTFKRKALRIQPMQDHQAVQNVHQLTRISSARAGGWNLGHQMAGSSCPPCCPPLIALAVAMEVLHEGVPCTGAAKDGLLDVDQVL